MNILITGGNGYVAQSIYKALKNEHNITLITRQDFDLVDTKATNAWFQDKYFDIVIHTAIVGGSRLKPEDESIIKSNLQMWRNLLQNQSNFDRLIQFGSGAEIYAKDTPYGLSKHVIAESIKDKPNFTNIRIFAVFDKNELDRRFIKSNIKRYINKEPIVIHQDKYMDFFYMEDLIEILKYSFTHPEIKVIDCTYPSSYKLSEIANLINSLSNYKVPIQIENSDLGREYVGNFVDLGINLKGIEYGIKTVYNEY